jgi:hypothetical protein
MKLKRVFCWPVVISIGTVLFAGSGKQEIRKIDFEKVIKNSNSDCQSGEGHKPWVDQIDYWDVDGDGQEEAAVVASSCMTGTGGPDIHSIFKLDSNNHLMEMEFEALSPAKRKSIYGSLVGNSNYRFKFSRGLLMEVWHDSSGREEPLILIYKWNGKKLALVKIKKKAAIPSIPEPCPESHTEKQK